MKTFYRNSIFNNIVETWDVIRVKETRSLILDNRGEAVKEGDW